jgi:hypothetical protein
MSAFGYRTNPLPERYARKLARGSRTFGGQSFKDASTASSTATRLIDPLGDACRARQSRSY